MFEAGAGGGGVPGEIQADSAGHDGSDARGRRPLHVGAVLVLPSPFCLSPLLVSGRKPKSIRIGRQRRPWRRLLHEGAALGEFWGDGESAPLVGVRRLCGLSMRCWGFLHCSFAINSLAPCICFSLCAGPLSAKVLLVEPGAACWRRSGLVFPVASVAVNHPSSRESVSIFRRIGASRQARGQGAPFEDGEGCIRFGRSPWS